MENGLHWFDRIYRRRWLKRFWVRPSFGNEEPLCVEAVDGVDDRLGTEDRVGMKVLEAKGFGAGTADAKMVTSVGFFSVTTVPSPASAPGNAYGC
ncbi:hypothetical protein NDU88_006402 [Pleurodeles waltl]|uniref:Uncharacterized protein n=1 Tax=Pleurodeles waltl TaxID=8319 RepID=A0AAV7PJM1_PLEWA|nr:hypothetical protein NDU88_006402 [Pleurodeles waltl]